MLTDGNVKVNVMTKDTNRCMKNKNSDVDRELNKDQFYFIPGRRDKF